MADKAHGLELRAAGITPEPPACVMAAAVLPTSQTRVTQSTLPSPYLNVHGRNPRSPAERFTERYIPEPNTGCWLWLGWTDRAGYGGFKIEGVTQKAHRVSWMLSHGDLPGLHVLHRCDTPACVNPSHLFLGDNNANIADKMAKGRHWNGKDSLTRCERKIVAERKRAGESAVDLAREYGITKWYVYQLASGRRDKRPSPVIDPEPRCAGPPAPLGTR